MLFHRDAGEIGHLLAQPGETIEQGGLTGVRRPHQRHGTHRRRAEQFRYRCTAATAAMAIAAIAHGILRVLSAGTDTNFRRTLPETWLSVPGFAPWACSALLSGRTVKRRAVSRRSAISEPSTWN